MDCLPEHNEWSAGSQWLLLQTHLDALQEHLQALQSAVATGPQALIAAEPHLHEIQQRSLEACDMLQVFKKLPAERLQALTEPLSS